MELPKFEYHPNPIATGAVKSSDEICECCDKARGYVYNSTLYAEDEVEAICPWCISDGSAAKKFNGMFSADYPLRAGGIPSDVIATVCERTPGYNSWQQEEWQIHCGDACEFHGDAEKKELLSLQDEALQHFLKKEMIKSEVWQEILEHYEKGGNPAVYKFKCHKCSEYIFTMDFT